MAYTYFPEGTCSQIMEFDIIDNVLQSVNIIGGCSGNLQGISALIKGMKVDDIIAKLEGIRCGSKTTSCPDQLAQALKQWKQNNK